MTLNVNVLLHYGVTPTQTIKSGGKEYEVKLYLLSDEVRHLYKAVIRKPTFKAEFSDFWKNLILINPFEVYHICLLTRDGLGLFVRLHTVQVEITLKAQ